MGKLIYDAKIKITFKLLIKLFFIVNGLMILFALSGCHTESIGMLNPKGIVALQERKLLFDILALMLIVVLPVIVMSITFVYHYQVSHRIRDYKPKWSHNFFLELIWWGVPCIIITILAIITWKKTYELDPYKPLPTTRQPPLVVEAVALPWKWLFIYPEQKIATINYLKIPVDRQIELHTTADNVAMSAFFIPQIGSQIYSMAGMSTPLHLEGNQIGTFEGINTQYNGYGFSDMRFTVQVVDSEKMQSWVEKMKKYTKKLTKSAYLQLLTPSHNNSPEFFSEVTPHLFSSVIDTYRHTFGKLHPRANLAKSNNELSKE